MSFLFLQCGRCTFSCRSEDILEQHMRLHANEPSSSNASAVSTPTLKSAPKSLIPNLPTIASKDHDYAAPTPMSMTRTPSSSKDTTPVAMDGSLSGKKVYKVIGYHTTYGRGGTYVKKISSFFLKMTPLGEI